MLFFVWSTRVARKTEQSASGKARMITWVAFPKTLMHYFWSGYFALSVETQDPLIPNTAMSSKTLRVYKEPTIWYSGKVLGIYFYHIHLLKNGNKFICVQVLSPKITVLVFGKRELCKQTKSKCFDKVIPQNIISLPGVVSNWLRGTIPQVQWSCL